MTRQDKFEMVRKQLVMDMIEEMGEEKTRRYLLDYTHREAINEMARRKSLIVPDRDLSIERFRRKNKIKAKA